METKDFVVRFAGEGGQGVVTAAAALAQAAAQVGYHVLTFSTFPSQIRGGPTWTQVRVSTAPILSSGDFLNVLVAFNKEAYDTHRGEVNEGGVVIYNSGDFQLESDGQSFGLPFADLARSTGNLRAANFVVVGALAHLVDMPHEYLAEFNRKRYTRGRPNDQEIIESNNKALLLGREGAAESGFSLGTLPPAIKPEMDQVLINGNQALSMGAMAAGLNCFIGYPISPATSILEFMEANLVGEGRFAYQASSELESINSVVGAGYAGKKAMTATAGPGFTLMGEGLGFAWMAEIPCVVVDVQRGGPATGLPTKTEQSDFLTALHPAHGDMELPIIAPGDVEECFFAAIKALNWAERYQGPVILLSEHNLSERAQNIPRPDLTSVTVENRQVHNDGNGYLRYEAATLSPMPIPGGPGSYVANASEHDPYGDTTHRPDRHIQMTHRRFDKINLLVEDEYESENANQPVVLLPWGGTKGPAREAYNRLMEMGEELGWFYTMNLNPLPPTMLEELKQKELVIVPELNYLGQFSSFLRSKGINAESITQYTGLPFKVYDLTQRIFERNKAHTEKKARV
ncbi:MAG: 2-oxoacid:acceptor oxidoreductase subunit alpha [Dehalococcoidia bacterium]